MSTFEEREDLAFEQAEEALAELGLVLEKGSHDNVEVRTQKGRVVFSYGASSDAGTLGNAWDALDGFIAGWRLLQPAVEACWSVFQSCTDMDVNLGALDDVAAVLRTTDDWTPEEEEALQSLRD